MKKLVVNCAVCDMTRVQEETLAGYESIKINCAMILVSAGTKVLINKYPVQMNTASVVEVPEGADIRQHNGKCVISSGFGMEKDTVLMVNGKLIIEKNGLEAAQSCSMIQVNGKVIAPRSIVGKLGNLSVNGKIVAYPDNAILLKPVEVIDRTFTLRAKQALYYAEKSIVFTDKDIDVQKIADKGVRFESPYVIVKESFCEALVPLIDESAEIEVIPDDMAFINDNAELDARLIRRYGKRLYVKGDLIVKDADALRQTEKLYVGGTVHVIGSLKDVLPDMDIDFENMEVIREYGCEMRDKVIAKVDRKLLEKYPEGVLVCDCATVRIDKDIDEDMILERLILKDVAQVSCTPEQENAVTAVSTGVANVNTGDDGIMNKILNVDPDAKVINAANYVM